MESDNSAAVKLLQHGRPPLAQYVALRALREADEHAFFRLLHTNPDEIMPIVYTPTVGDACTHYHDLEIKTVGTYFTPADVGKIEARLRAMPKDISVCVVTDGERILGLGDLGAGGMGISEGKILLYTALGGVPPSRCLPVCIDVGTNNNALLSNPRYKGLRQPRLRGAAYDALMDEFLSAFKKCFPSAVLQFEDFGNTTAFSLLEKHRTKLRCFNDDIQGTACVALAGLLCALRAKSEPLAAQRILFLGAGEAGTGIGELVALALHLRHAVPIAAARGSCLFMDSKGLVCAARKDLQHHKIPFAHDVPFQATLADAVRALRPTVLIGVSTQAGAFTPEVLQLMAGINPRPVIFPLSNPTSCAECTAAEAFRHAGPGCLFASGSPFGPLEGAGGRVLRPSQANNAYVFPALGYGSVLSRASHIPDELFLVAAEALASLVSDEELSAGSLFPAFQRIEAVSQHVTAAVSQHAVEAGYGRVPEGGLPPGGWPKYVKANFWRPLSRNQSRL